MNNSMNKIVNMSMGNDPAFFLGGHGMIGSVLTLAVAIRNSQGANAAVQKQLLEISRNLRF